jgi:hypothetical protein
MRLVASVTEPREIENEQALPFGACILQSWLCPYIHFHIVLTYVPSVHLEHYIVL